MRPSGPLTEGCGRQANMIAQNPCLGKNGTDTRQPSSSTEDGVHGEWHRSPGGGRQPSAQMLSISIWLERELTRARSDTGSGDQSAGGGTGVTTL